MALNVNILVWFSHFHCSNQDRCKLQFNLPT